MKKIIPMALAFGILTGSAHAAKLSVERIGDMTQVIVPALALGMTLEEDDWEGTRQLAYSFAATMTTETLLKAGVESQRPNGSNTSSFPSGHTAAAFSGATFIHRRYGLWRAALPYLMAGFTAYSRVESKWHKVDDVVAGAIIAGAWTMAFTDRKQPPITVRCDSHGAMLNFDVKF